MRFSAFFAIVATFSVVLASPAEVETRELTTTAYVPVKVVDGRTSVSEGSPNGLYLYHNETHAAYYGTGPTSFVGSRSPSRRAASVSCDVSCNGQQSSASSISTAESGLEGFFGSGLCWSKQVFYLFNSVYAFGCDYGHGQCETTSDYQEEIACVDDTCGNTQGGWNSVPSSKVTYGREFGSFGC